MWTKRCFPRACRATVWGYQSAFSRRDKQWSRILYSHILPRFVGLSDSRGCHPEQDRHCRRHGCCHRIGRTALCHYDIEYHRRGLARHIAAGRRCREWLGPESFYRPQCHVCCGRHSSDARDQCPVHQFHAERSCQLYRHVCQRRCSGANRPQCASDQDRHRDRHDFRQRQRYIQSNRDDQQDQG